jgi:WD40 repeat protein
MPSIFISHARGLLLFAAASLLLLGMELPPSAAQEVAPADAGKTAAAPGPGAATTISFEREEFQVATVPIEDSALAFSANDRFLAVIGGGGARNTREPGQNLREPGQLLGEPGRLRIWGMGKKKPEVAYISIPRGGASVALSPDGRRVAWSNWGGEIWLREVGGAELLHENLRSPAHVALSADGKLLVAATQGRRLQTWDALTGKPAAAYRGGVVHFSWIGFSPDGKYLVGGGESPDEPLAAVWRVGKPQPQNKLKGNPVPVEFASISPDSKTLATSGRNSILLWDLATGEKRSQTDNTDAAVTRIQFSPDGALLASAGDDKNDGVVTLWDAATGKVVGTLAGHGRDVRALAFTHDGKTLATGGGDGSVRLWDVASRKQTSLVQESRAVPVVEGQAAALLAVAYAPDGSSVATADEDGQVNVYGMSPPRLLRSWLAHADAAAALVYSPDGKTLVSGGYDKVIKFWNPQTGELIRSLSGHKGWVLSLAFSHDGQTLASGSYDRSIRLWNVADGVERKQLAGHKATVRSLEFSHDDRLLASASADQTVRLWDAASGQQQATLSGHGAVVRSVAFSSDDRLLASGGEDQTIKLWNVGTHDLRATLSGHKDVVSAVAFAQQTLVSAGWDRTIRTWDVDSQQMRSNNMVSPNVTRIVALSLTADGRRMVSGSDQSLILWKSAAVDAQATASFGPYTAPPRSAAFSPDGKSLAVAAGGAEETDFYLYDRATAAEKYHVTFPGTVRSIAFAPAGDVLALGSADRQLLLVDAASGRELASLEKDRAEVDPERPGMMAGEVVFSPDGKLLAAASLNQSIHIYDVEHRTLAQTLSGHPSRVFSIAFSPDQKQLVSGGAGNTAIVWDLTNGERRYSLPTQQGAYFGVAWSPDGKLLATGCGTGVCNLWHAETGTPLRTFTSELGAVTQVRFSPDGKLLAAAGAGRLVRMFDVATGEPVRTYSCNTGAVFCVRFSPDGKSFVTTGGDGKANVWPVLPPEPK